MKGDPLFHLFFTFFLPIPSLICEDKRCKINEEMILTLQRHTKHLLACQNTQHRKFGTSFILVYLQNASAFHMIELQ